MSDSKELGVEVGSVENALQAQASVQIDKVTRLEVRFEAPGVESKRLYANGRMQVKVWVFVEAQDADGNAVSLPYFPDLVSARLIEYHTGKPLQQDVYTGRPLQGWNSSHVENKYSHEVPGWGLSSLVSDRLSAFRQAPLVFWVSSSVVGQTQVAVEVTVQGKVYRTNNTTNPGGTKINNSVVLHAEKKATYAVEQFRWESEPLKVGDAFNTFSLYHLGLYLGSRQVELFSWESTRYNPDNRYPIEFCRVRPNSLAWAIKYFTGVLPSATQKSVRVNLPGGQYDIEVHKRSGELSLVNGFSSRLGGNFQTRNEVFPFTVIDEYGNDHALSIEIDERNLKFNLRRG